MPRGGTTDGGTPGDTVRWLEFTTPHAGAARASVQAFVKLRGGAWKLEDWSNRATVRFCYANASERVDSLVIIPCRPVLDRGSESVWPHVRTPRLHGLVVGVTAGTAGSDHRPV